MNKRRLGEIEKIIKRKYQGRLSSKAFGKMFKLGFLISAIGYFLYMIFSGEEGTVIEYIFMPLQVGVFAGFLIGWLVSLAKDLFFTHKKMHFELDENYLEFEEETLELLLKRNRITDEEFNVYLNLRSISSNGRDEDVN